MTPMQAGVALLILAAAFAQPASVSAQQSPDRATVSQIYSGQKRLPDFAGRDRKYRDFRTRIINGIKAGPNFAGHYSLIIFGCGASCRSVVLADVTSGRLYDFPLSGEEFPALDLKFKPNSRDVIAHWEDSERCMRELLTWTGSSFTRAGAKDVGDRQVCSDVYDR